MANNAVGYLLDTHIFLWALAEERKLNSSFIQILKNPKNKVFVSVASAWEISIKHKKGILPLKTTLAECFEKSPFEILEISLAHVLQLERLPWYHKDPFDRLLIAQAQEEKLILLTVDSKIKKYNVRSIE